MTMDRDEMRGRISRILKWWEAGFPMVPGERNHNLHVLCRSLNGNGIPQADALELCLGYVEHGSRPFTEAEIRSVVRSAYRHHDEHGANAWAAGGGSGSGDDRQTVDIRPPLPGFRVPHDEVVSTLNDAAGNNFLNYLRRVYDPKDVERVAREYLVGTWSAPGAYAGAPVFWQVDDLGEVHAGKVRQFDEQGHGTATNWHHYLRHGIRAADMPEKGLQLDQCLFGLHLTTHYPKARVGIVEAEKTAIIASIAMPGVLWVAAGSKDLLNVERLLPLKGRRVLVIPDLNAADKWRQVMEDADPLFPQVVVSTALEKIATDQDRERGADLADFLLDGRIRTEQSEL